MNQKKVLGLLFALIATLFMFILVVSASPSDGYETPGIIDGGIYTITNTRSGKNLDIKNNGRSDNTAVIQYTADSEKNNQKFRIDYRGNGRYTITAMNSLKLLTVQNAVNQDEVPVVIYSASATSASNGGQYEGQYFKIRANSNGTFTFLTMASNYTKVLDVYSAVNNRQNNGEVLQQHTEIGTANQKFRLTLCNTIGFETSKAQESIGIIYRIKNVYSGRYLDVYGATASSGTNVQTYTYHSGDSLKWTIQNASNTKNGEYRLFTEIGNYGSFVLNVDSATNNCNISSSKNTQSVFHIIRINEEPYKGLYYIKFGDKYVTQETGTSYNVKLTTSAGTNSMWSFEKCNKLEAIVYTNNYWYWGFDNWIKFDTSPSGEYITDVLSSKSYAVGTYEDLTDIQAAKNHISGDKSMIFHCGHGNAGVISFTADGDTFTNISTDDILAYSLNDLSNLSCFISTGCYVGMPDSNNTKIQDAMYERGASFVFAFQEQTIYPRTNTWIETFMNSAAERKTVYQCFSDANAELDTLFANPYDYYFVGDRYQVLVY